MKEWTASELVVLRRESLKWFKKHSRDLPWRRTHDPYRIWISEIMLQQTQVATVIPYYERFLAEFPTVAALAAADEDRVLFHWAGLGYYRRARQLHAAAKVVVEKHGGQFPREFEAVLALPGIGRYTAGAICSFAYDAPTPIVEANTQRLYARLLHLKTPLTLAASQQALWSFAELILPPGKGTASKGSGAINYAVMEIGAQVCFPKDPDCDHCPLANLCPTLAAQDQAIIPAPKPPKEYENRTEVALLVRDEAQGYLMRRCEPGERWAGLWDFPRYDVTGASIGNKLKSPALDLDLASAVTQFRESLGTGLKVGEEGVSIKHGVTRYRINLRCFHAEPHQIPSKIPANYEWVPREGLKHLALNSTAKRIAKTLLPIEKINGRPTL